MNLNKGISTPVAILLIIVISAAVGTLVWQLKPAGQPDKQASDYTTQSACEEAGYYWYNSVCHENQKEERSPEEPELTKEKALSLLGAECSSEGVPGEYSSCTMDVSEQEDQWTVTITYDGLYSDSIKAERDRITITYEDGEWVKGETTETQQCQSGRGHQDFSAEPCL